MALAILCAGSSSAKGDPDDGGAVDAGTADTSTADPVVTSFRDEAGRVHELIDDQLPPDVQPRSLFAVDITDEVAIGLERERLETLLRATAVDAGKAKPARHDAGVEAGVSAIPSPEQWQARLDLDRARLAFFELPRERRDELLEHHRARAAAVGPSDEDRRAAESEAKRQQALAAAQEARTEAERAVSEEYARLLSVEATQTAFAKKLAAGRDEIESGREATLGWQRRSRALRTGVPNPDVADDTYDALRRALRGARDDLDQAIHDAHGGVSSVPVAGPDPLGSLQVNLDLGQVRAERQRIDATAARLTEEEKAFNEDRASQLFDEVDKLNAERLALLPCLSPSKHAAIIGFTDAGWDQAKAEIRQLTLIARYHRSAASTWLVGVRSGHYLGDFPVSTLVRLFVEWLVIGAAAFWLRRRLPIGLQTIWKRARAEDRARRLPSPSLPTRIAAFVVETHRPVLWLAVAIALSSLLPTSARALLEVRLLSLVVQWVFGGAFIVASVNAIAGVGSTDGEPQGAPVLRLRSLRLVGRVIVAFGLILALTARLVGAGTIYRWVFSSCWLASIPVFLLLVRWWREKIFERADRSRRKTVFARWILTHRRGWQSFIAAMAGAIWLFGRGAWRIARSWLGELNVTRTVLAYLFRRELDKLEAQSEAASTEALHGAPFEALGPEEPPSAWIPLEAEADLERLEERAKAGRGGVIAIVGPRGMGKTSALARLSRAIPSSVSLSIPVDSDVGFAVRARAALATAPKAILFDDAHHLVRPIMGGLAPLDALLAVASGSSTSTTWIIAFDEILWLFLQRARGSRPLFDGVIHLYPWREEHIVDLLRTRTAAAGLAPSFEHILDRLPANADELDRQEAIEARAASYYRLLWDYAGGNPGIALHMWRRALGADASGAVQVRFFQAPNLADLEPLPDQTVFVLRALLQLEAATAEDIAAATMLRPADIVDALRYAHSQRYVERNAERYSITWTWQRAVSVFLQRRHLLSRSS